MCQRTSDDSMLCRINMRIGMLTVLFGFGATQEYFEQLRHAKYGKHVQEIPKRFELRGDNANSEFEKHFKQIQELSKHENITVIYKVKLELVKPMIKKNYKKSLMKKGKSKKYNVPLKKNSMKLSNFEVFLRKMAEHTARKSQSHNDNIYPSATTEKQKIMTTKQILLKYKPIISRVKTNYAKVVRPVKNRIITLTV